MKVIVDTSYRVHINSIDMNGFSGRCCGGLGFSLKDLSIKVICKIAEKDTFDGKYPDKMENIVNKIRKIFNINFKFNIKVENEYFEHCGLGSETQMYLAISVGILKLCGMEANVMEIAKKMSFSGVSGIGLGAFIYGNFVVDSGYILGPNKKDFVQHSLIPPEIIFNSNIPDNWKVLLVIPKKIMSISAEEEDKFFKMYTPVPISEVKDISYYTLMGVIPAILEKDFNRFISSLDIISSLGTKKAELKINESSTDSILRLLKEKYGFGGLSSLGPACYTFIDENREKINIEELKQIFKNCDIYYTSVRNEPFTIEVYDE